MNESTARKLIEINNRFYQIVGKFFDAARNYSWKGWLKLIPEIKKLGGDIKVLDVGCGNGRFAEFLSIDMPKIDFEYIGVDGSKELMDKARDRFSDLKKAGKDIIHKLVESELIYENWESSIGLETGHKFDLIVLMGVMHHVPGEDNRIKLLGKVKSLLSDEGLLVFTTWKYMDNERLRGRLIDKSSAEGKGLYAELGLDPGDLDEGDNILDWRRGESAYRYSHYYTDEEVFEILEGLELEIIETFVADGKADELNGYFLVRKSSMK